MVEIGVKAPTLRTEKALVRAVQRLPVDLEVVGSEGEGLYNFMPVSNIIQDAKRTSWSLLARARAESALELMYMPVQV